MPESHPEQKVYDREILGGNIRMLRKRPPGRLTEAQMRAELQERAGLRESEMAALDWSDMAASVHVGRTYHKASTGPVWEDPKSEKSERDVPLPKSARARLRCLRGIGPVFVKDGRRMTPDEIGRGYRARMKKLGLKVGLHNLRHKYATDLIAAGVPLEVVSRLLGHSTIQITADLYVGPLTDLMENAAAALEAYRTGPTGARARGQ